MILALITEPLPPAGDRLHRRDGRRGAAGCLSARRSCADPGFRMPAEAVRWALSGFANGTVWLIFAAFVFAMGYEKTGLGRRIALLLVKWLGRRTLGLGYAMALVRPRARARSRRPTPRAARA